MAKQPFTPRELPAQIDYRDLVENIANAHRALGSLNSLLNYLPNPKLLGRTLQTKEAVLSSKIEGTQATMDEVFEYEAQNSAENDDKKQDIKEVINYRRALDKGVKLLKTKPISENLIKDLHKILLSLGRGHNKAPGEFRKIQAYIGRPGATIENALFIPPSADKIIPLFGNLEKYLNSSNEKDRLVQIAIAHYQFEAIHPFLDGNGRVGRLLISLFLFENKLLSHPFLYLSEFFEENRQDYYELLRNVSEQEDWQSWIKFFLNAITIQSKKAETTANNILTLYQKYKEIIDEFNSVYAIHLIDAIFTYPVFSSASIRKNVKIKNTQTLFNLIKKFIDKGIIKEKFPKRKRGKIYVFDELVKILNK